MDADELSAMWSWAANASAQDWLAGFKSLSATRVFPMVVFGCFFYAMKLLFKLAQELLRRRRARKAVENAKKPPKPKEPSMAPALLVLAGLFLVCGCVLGLCYHRYGWLFFVDSEKKRL